ncbi:MAG: electron transfer flavoprotein subunit beta/FixA family protein [Acidimicrobiales bacterium]|jgi:electron transfer flavoprotein beta subunit
MNVLVCVKRVAMVGAKIVITPDGQDIDTRHLGFTISPHEECAIEEAVRIVEHHGGTVSVLTLGPSEAVEQLRDAAATGASRLLHLQGGEREWDPIATAQAIAEAVATREEADGAYDLILFGNEAPDTGDYQVGIRVAHLLGRPCVSGAKYLELSDGRAQVRREFRGGDEFFEFDLPGVVAVKEGINLPRYPSLPGRMRAKKATIDESEPRWREGALHKQRLSVPSTTRERAELLGTGVAAVPALLALLERLGVLA